MKKENIKMSEAASLRKKAEEKLANRKSQHSLPLAEGDAVRLIHELEVYHIELELQNEELRNAIDSAEAATEKYTNLYDFAPAGYFTLDRNGVISELNLNGASMLGNDRSSLIGTNFTNFISHDTRYVFSEFFKKVFETCIKQTCDVRVTIHNSPSGFYHLEGVISENKLHCLITTIDITERLLAEERLKENEARLKELNATKDKFFSIIAHDLRGPFSNIIGFTDLLKAQIKVKNYDAVGEYAEFIHKSSLRAMSLLMNLLEWASLQTGKIEFNPGNIDVSEIIEEVIELLKHSALQKSITLSEDLPENIRIFADKEMISGVLRNLVSNAIKFTNPGGMVSISAHQNKAELMMMVSDNGVGIEKKNFEKLFQIEGNQSTKGTRNEVGSGLGLILCKEFILLHNGKIWVESEPGKGSSFYFTIPSKLD